MPSSIGHGIYPAATEPTGRRGFWQPRWLVFCGWFVGDWLSWQTPGALSPDLEDLL
jgi:hypothetical protein